MYCARETTKAPEIGAVRHSVDGSQLDVSSSDQPGAQITTRSTAALATLGLASRRRRSG